MKPGSEQRPSRRDRPGRAGLGRALRFWLALLLLLPAGCGEKKRPAADTLRATAERGPLKVTLSVRPKAVRLAEPVWITLEAQAPEDMVLRLPEEGDFGDLPVRIEDRPEPRPAPEHGRLWRCVYVLEPLTAGRVTLPALSVEYASIPPEGATETQPADAWRVLETGPLEIEVRSALTTQDSMLEPRDIAGPLPPRWTLSEVFRVALWPVVGLLLLAGAAWLWWRVRRRPREAPPVLPEVLALQALSALEREDCSTPERVRAYYYRLTEIVRTYIERKFDLAAPEMTTPEFLQALARDRGRLPYDTDRLRDFLEACDLVKYAAFHPRQEDAVEALSLARAFVQTTAAAAQAASSAGERAAMGGQAA